MVKENQIQFRASDDVLSALQERSEWGKSPSLVAEQLLEAHLFLLRRNLPTFTEAEAMLMADAMNGVIIDYHVANALWFNVADAIEMDGLDQKWHVDGKALIGRLRQFTPFEQWAIYDAIRRAWTSESYRTENMEERLRKVGLVK